MKNIANNHGFSLIESKDLPEINGKAHVMKHDASGARLLFLQNDDTNKSFSISFKTPASDDTGVFHILEHSVLCGSEKFPVKEPFVNLLKSSMQTFLNAMTFPDKTMYPVASTNSQDLLNLADVYMDAVFHPQIYNKKEIFEQEGWHLEFADEEQKTLTFNGVVFNEMKGALSDPDSVLYDALSAALFPDTTYRFESGGTPESIPDLTYEAFLDTHHRHYSPQNSYIILYGDIDSDDFLGFLDEKYLSKLANENAIEGNSAISAINPLDLQKPVVNENVKVEMQLPADNAQAAFGYVAGSITDRKRMYAIDLLIDAIMGSNEAPLKRALIDAGIADDCSANLVSSIAQPFVMVQFKGLKGSGEEAIAKAYDVINKEIERLANGELDKAIVEAALSHAEFTMREHNFGYADGVVLAMTAMNGWLYDDDMPYEYLEYEDDFTALRNDLKGDYFNELLREIFLENNHRASVELVAVDKPCDAELQAKLSKLESSLDSEMIENISAELEVLRAAQMAEDSKDALATLPKLSIEDIKVAPKEGKFEIRELDGRKYLAHDIDTNGIAYINCYYDIDSFSFEEMPLLNVLSLLLGRLDTKKYSSTELDTLIQGKLGNLSHFVDVYVPDDAPETVVAKFVNGMSFLPEYSKEACEIAHEVITSTRFDNLAKILEILIQKRVMMEQVFANSGHTVALSRASSYSMKSAVLKEQISGIDFYDYLCDLIDHFDERKEMLANDLSDLLARINKVQSFVSFAGSLCTLEDYFAQFKQENVSLDEGYASSTGETSSLVIPEPKDKHEGLCVPSDVTFTAISANRLKFNSPLSGAWFVAANVLSLDYLWNEVRVMGGAYGVGFKTARSGSTYFYSYRDPHIDETVKRFDDAGTWLQSFNPSDDEFDGYIVSSAASFDAPVKARALMRRQDGMFICHFTPEMRMRYRDEVIKTTIEDIQKLGPVVSDVANADYVCTIGSKTIIENSNEHFNIVDLVS